MLNRRILRIKAFKSVYALAENPAMTVKEAEAQLEQSCESTRDLHLFMLALIPAVTAEAKSRIEAAQSKFNPTEEEKHPNLKFVNNAIAPILAADPDFQKIISKRHLSWGQYDVFMRHLYESMRASDYFAEYMASTESSPAEDAALFVKMFENELVDSAELEAILEDLSIWWNDDLAYALTACCRVVEDLAKGARWNMPPLYLSEMNGSAESDKAFVVKLVRIACIGFQKYTEAVAASTHKWDKDRICTTDLALIVCGQAESDAFSATPAKVIINEYVEISKYYSTPESRSFVNGLLDKLINKK